MPDWSNQTGQQKDSKLTAQVEDFEAASTAAGLGGEAEAQGGGLASTDPPTFFGTAG